MFTGWVNGWAAWQLPYCLPLLSTERDVDAADKEEEWKTQTLALARPLRSDHSKARRRPGIITTRAVIGWVVESKALHVPINLIGCGGKIGLTRGRALKGETTDHITSACYTPSWCRKDLACAREYSRAHANNLVLSRIELGNSNDRGLGLGQPPWKRYGMTSDGLTHCEEVRGERSTHAMPVIVEWGDPLSGRAWLVHDNLIDFRWS
ncbi:hypothetical protein PILCRDRAFT_85702 [Piloderma croceum F 1598]|uniref:Uncharacterized protein n=1 Tax=Piloderma croceum (strain F 1598) TaxID=765440 RepID=A0A0C3GB85_PILCF|nr:hypothetical protein PILCRDRAFT_85702 [Piloderma croceum F 1598]